MTEYTLTIRNGDSESKFLIPEKYFSQPIKNIYDLYQLLVDAATESPQEIEVGFKVVSV